MNEKEVLEGNKLIAEFDGMYCLNEYAMFAHEGAPKTPVYYKDMLHHSSWDWLMPVVEKIIEIDITPAPNWRGYRIEIVPRGYVKISGFPMQKIHTNVSVCGSLIIAVWKAVVEFIKYYNENKC